MASPQKENGFTPIAHDILKALARHVISPDEWRVLMIIFWKTYGWSKKEDRISYGQFEGLTGISRSHVSRAVNKLLRRNMIVKGVTQSGNTTIASYGFQKNYDLWVLPEQATGCYLNGEQGVTCLGSKVLPDQVTTKEYKEKEKDLKTSLSGIAKTVGHQNDIPKVKINPVMEDSDAYRLASLLFQKIQSRKSTFKKPNLKEWGTVIDRMVRLDGRDLKTIENVIGWCQQDSFWQNNILSTEKLRKQFDQLEMKMDADEGWLGLKRNGAGGGAQKKKGEPPPGDDFLRKLHEERKRMLKEQEQKNGVDGKERRE